MSRLYWLFAPEYRISSLTMTRSVSDNNYEKITHFYKGCLPISYNTTGLSHSVDLTAFVLDVFSSKNTYLDKPNTFSRTTSESAPNENTNESS